MLVKVVNLTALHHSDEGSQISAILSRKVLDDAPIVFFTFRLGEIFLVPDKSNRIELNVHKLVGKIIQSLSIDFINHSFELEEVRALWFQIRRQVSVIQSINSILYGFGIPLELRLSIKNVQSSRSSQEGSRTFGNCVLLPIH